MFGWSPVSVLRFFAKAFRALGLFLGVLAIFSLFVPSLRGGETFDAFFLLSILLQAAYYIGGGTLAWATLSALASVAAKQEQMS